MGNPLTAAHWCYLIGVLVIIATMLARKNIVVPAVIATLMTATIYTGSLLTGIASIFTGSLVAAAELFNIFLVIAFITAMLGAMKEIGADELMVKPFRKVMRGPTAAFLVIGAVTYIISLFFWPTPAVPLVGAMLIPVAIRAGLPPLVTGVVIAVAGQGMALSSDFIIKVAPGLSAKSAGVPLGPVADKSMVLSLIIGITAMIVTYLFYRRRFRHPSSELLTAWEDGADPDTDPKAINNTPVPSISVMRNRVLRAFVRTNAPQPSHDRSYTAADTTDNETTTYSESSSVRLRHVNYLGEAAYLDNGAPTAIIDDIDTSSDTVVTETREVADTAPDAPTGTTRKARLFAIAVPAAYFVFIIYLLITKITPSVPGIEGDDAAALVGGIAVIMTYMICATDKRSQNGFFEACAGHIVEGLVFAFRAMGIVIPIAGFFFLGNGEFAGRILGLGDGQTAPTFLIDLVGSAQSAIPNNGLIAAFSVLLIGIIGGLDGSGFSGLPLTGSLAGSLGPVVDMDPSTLAAIGQMGNIWAGGGTLVAWSSLIAVAGFARVPVVELARKCFFPVMTGLILSTAIAYVIW